MVELRQADEDKSQITSEQKEINNFSTKMLRALFLLVILCSAYYTQKVAQCLREDLMGNNEAHNHMSKRYSTAISLIY